MKVDRVPQVTAGDQCANCGTLIGNLEMGCVWQDKPVCYNCYNRLATPVQQPMVHPPYHPPYPPPPAVISHPIYVPVFQKKSRPLTMLGWALALIGLPLLCLGGVGLIPLIAGIVLLIVGACTGQ